VCLQLTNDSPVLAGQGERSGIACAAPLRDLPRLLQLTSTIGTPVHCMHTGPAVAAHCASINLSLCNIVAHLVESASSSPASASAVAGAGAGAGSAAEYKTPLKVAPKVPNLASLPACDGRAALAKRALSRLSGSFCAAEASQAIRQR
jgi:hypothetical protein